MSFITSVVGWLNTKRLHQIDLFRKFPLQTQEEVLFKLIERAKDTQFGKAHGFASYKGIHDFQKNVPLTDYDALKPYVDRLRQGEFDLLWPGDIRWFAK